jgi:hypothetical protein
MLRKSLLGAAAGLTLAVAALAPSAASAGGFHLHVGGPGFYGPSYGYGYGYTPYYGPDCFYKKVKVWSHKWDKWIWKTKKVCY